MDKRLQNTQKILYTFIFPLIGLSLYCAVFLIISKLYAVIDVNYHFCKGLLLFSLAMIGIIGLFLTGLIVFTKIPIRTLKFKYRIHFDFFDNRGLILLPMVPIVQYLAANQEILTIFDFMVIFLAFLLVSLTLVVFLPMLCGRTDAAAAMSVVGAVFAFTINAMAQLSRTFSWFERGNLLIQMVVFCSVLLFCSLLASKKNRIILNILVISLTLINALPGLTQYSNSPSEDRIPIESNPMLTLFESEEPVKTPNIYLFIYDAYVSNETMLSYGIDNSDQEKFLQQSGFTLYPGTYSIGAASIESMSRVINASSEYYGNPRRAVSGDGVMQNLLGRLGYETYGIFQNSFFFRGIVPTYDFSLPSEDSATYATIIPAVLMGEFRFDFEFNQMSQQEFIREKQEIFSSMTGKRFVYMHTYLPSHSQNSGACRVNEIELYEDRLEAANVEMQHDLEYVIAMDPEAIIIVAGDHGPYLTKNCTATGTVYDISEISRVDIQDRFGTFLAVRWPGDIEVSQEQITVLQDIFPVILAEMYCDESFLEYLPDSTTMQPEVISGVTVKDGVISGGIDDGEPLFLLMEEQP